ncbi:MAG TPA: MFS transporter [Bryobacteraceae bacterium]|nr:MFS transporter [Bryobacteraceae bacterium]
MLENARQGTATVAAATEVIGRYRWRICALCFFATTINYVDRQVLGVLAPELQRVFGWNELQYSNLVNAFQGAYAIGLLLAGSVIDRVGTRIGYAVAIGIWSLATIGTAFARSVFGFGVARFMLGIGESGNFPAALKTVAEWFPKKERALATGIFNCGTNVGAIVAPIVVPWLTVRYGWQSAFLVTGSLSALWIIPWVIMYRPPQNHPRVSAAELAYIQSDPLEPVTKIAWTRLLGHRQTWAFLIGKFMTDPIWWFFMFWLPKFLNSKHGLSISELGWPLVIVYNMATLGSIGGGWLAARFLKRGWSANRARKTAMLTCAITVTPIIFAANVANVWVAVVLVGLATASHQGWSANMFTLPSDMFPKRAVASVVGIGGFGGAVGGMVIATFTGFVLQFTGSYVPMFVIAGSVYLIALLIIHLLAPRLEPAHIDV